MTQSVTVIIPACGRTNKLRKCLAALSNQNLPDDLELEIIVALDGGDPTGEYASMPAPSCTRFLPLPRSGAAAVRNAAIQESRGELLLFMGNDTYPESNWVLEHLRAQTLRGEPGMVVGESRWMPWKDATVFDGLIRDTSMVFFFHHMKTGKKYGFRHFWTCNASLPRRMAEQVGGFDERQRPIGYEDLEFAYRVDKEFNTGVFYHSAATNIHDHRIQWKDYCNREACLGRAAACLFEVNSDCFRVIYGDEPAEAMRDAFITWLAVDEQEHELTEAKIIDRADRPLAEISDWPALCELLYRTHLPIKRRYFRSAFVEHFDLRHDVHWEDRLALGHSFP